MSALCEQGMIYLHKHTHIHIYLYRPSSWEHRCFLGVAGGLKSAGGEHLETPPRTPVTSSPYMSALCEQGMIYLHKHTHTHIYIYIFIHVQTFVMGGSLFSWGCRNPPWWGAAARLRSRSGAPRGASESCSPRRSPPRPCSGCTRGPSAGHARPRCGRSSFLSSQRWPLAKTWILWMKQAAGGEHLETPPPIPPPRRVYQLDLFVGIHDQYSIHVSTA